MTKQTTTNWSPEIRRGYESVYDSNGKLTGIKRYISVCGWWVAEDNSMYLSWVWGYGSKVKLFDILKKKHISLSSPLRNIETMLFSFYDKPPYHIPDTAKPVVFILSRIDDFSTEEPKDTSTLYIQMLQKDMQEELEPILFDEAPIGPSVFGIKVPWWLPALNCFCGTHVWKKTKATPTVVRWREEHCAVEKDETTSGKSDGASLNAEELARAMNSLPESIVPIVEQKTTKRRVKHGAMPSIKAGRVLDIGSGTVVTNGDAIKKLHANMPKSAALTEDQKQLLITTLHTAGVFSKKTDTIPVTNKKALTKHSPSRFTIEQTWYINQCLSDTHVRLVYEPTHDIFVLKSMKGSAVYALTAKDKQFLKYGAECKLTSNIQ